MPYKEPEKIKQYNKEYRIKNKEKINDIAREWRRKNKDKINKRTREWRRKNKDKTIQYWIKYGKKWKKNNKEKVNARARELYVLNREKILKRRKEWHFKNREKVLERKKRYRNSEAGLKKIKEYYLKNKERISIYSKNNREKINERIRRYSEYKNKTDISFKIKQNIRARISMALKNNCTTKATSTINLIGCTIQELKIYLENKFKPGMSWKNRHKWHIDHIIPIKYFTDNFDFSKLEVQQKCFHYTNLQPLWAHENLSKGAKVLI